MCLKYFKRECFFSIVIIEDYVINIKCVPIDFANGPIGELLHYHLSGIDPLTY